MGGLGGILGGIIPALTNIVPIAGLLTGDGEAGGVEGGGLGSLLGGGGSPLKTIMDAVDLLGVGDLLGGFEIGDFLGGNFNLGEGAGGSMAKIMATGPEQAVAELTNTSGIGSDAVEADPLMNNVANLLGTPMAGANGVGVEDILAS